MKKMLLFVIFILVSMSCFSQVFGPERCDWWPEKEFHHHWIHCNDTVPRIWKEYPTANHIFSICNGWEIWVGDYRLVPEYIIWKTDSIDAVTTVDACRFAYNYFLGNPDKRIYEHEQFIVLVAAIKRE